MKKQTIEETLSELIAKSGVAWTLDLKETKSESRWEQEQIDKQDGPFYGDLKRESDGMTLNIGNRGYDSKDGRISISLDCIETNYGERIWPNESRPYGEREKGTPKITLAKDAAPKRIASAIVSRLLPDADSVFLLMCERKRNGDDYQERLNANYAELRKAGWRVETRPHSKEPYIRFPGNSSPSISVSRDSVSFNHLSVPISLAIEIGKLIYEAEKATETEAK